MHDVFLAEAQFLSGSHADLLLDEVDAGDQFRDRVFHLDPCVHFDEVEVVVLVQQELAGAGVVVVRGLGHAHGGFADVAAHLLRQVGRGAFFHQLLVPTLQAAIALIEVHDVAVLVAK